MDETVYKKSRTPTSIKLEEKLLDRIKKDAIKENRSITGQIEYMIKQYYEIKKMTNI